MTGGQKPSALTDRIQSIVLNRCSSQFEADFLRFIFLSKSAEQKQEKNECRESCGSDVEREALHY